MQVGAKLGSNVMKLGSNVMKLHAIKQSSHAAFGIELAMQVVKALKIESTRKGLSCRHRDYCGPLIGFSGRA